MNGHALSGGEGSGEAVDAIRSNGVLLLISLAALVLFAGFVALGVWQVERLEWKRALIARVDARIHAAPKAAPAPADWVGIDPASQEYRRVTLTGRFDHAAETLVRASTARGSGYWVMTPFRTDRGFTVLVNRGFVTPEERQRHNRPDGESHIIGLVRITEPGGGFLRRNDPAGGQWYSRDVAAIATARHLDQVAPYFVDAEAGGTAPPVGGMTVVHFANNHLGYALTWFALAAMVAGGYMMLMREEGKRRRAIRGR